MNFKTINTIAWPVPGVEAAFTTRRGGVSVGCYASFNLGLHVGDRHLDVMANRLQLQQAFPDHLAVYMHQVHGNTVVRAGSDGQQLQESCDGIFTDAHNLLLLVMTADCLPLLLASADGAWIAAVHCGWRSLSLGIVPRALRELRKHGAQDLQACIGPGIGRDSFVVGAEVRERFVEYDRRLAACFATQGDGLLHCDLRAICRQQLCWGGVSCILDLGIDSCADRENFFSYRRDGITGRQACVICKKS